jgi:hypothetical protein
MGHLLMTMVDLGGYCVAVHVRTGVEPTVVFVTHLAADGATWDPVSTCSRPAQVRSPMTGPSRGRRRDTDLDQMCAPAADRSLRAVRASCWRASVP